MKRTLFILTSVFLTGCLLTACWKTRPFLSTDNPYGLPNATQTGADVFGFRLNDTSMIYKPYTSFSEMPRAYLNGTYKNDTLIVASPAKSPTSKTLGGLLIFQLYGNITSGKVYNLADTVQTSFFCYISGLPACIQKNNAVPFYPTSGTFTLTKLDVVKRIMSGRFDNIKIPVNNCTVIDTLNITDGRFDLHY